MAYKLALAGQDVKVYEEHKVIGEPVQCTGIVSSEFSKVMDLDDSYIVNKLDRVRVYSKNRKAELDINDIVIDRTKFDQWLGKKAKKAGVKVYMGHEYLGYANGEAVLVKKKKVVKEKCDILIGADGPISEVAKSNMLFGKRKFFTGVQARVKGKFVSSVYSVFLGSVAPGFFAWIVPESNSVARIGLAGRKGVAKRFVKFLESRRIKKKDIIDKQAGLIPIFGKSIVGKKDLYLIGDAAGQVKATTGGGLVPGIKSADVLVDCIINGKDYCNELKLVNRELKIHLLIRRMLDRFSDRDFNKLLDIVNSKRVSKVLKENNRDSSSKLVVNLLLADPRFLKYMTKIV